MELQIIYQDTDLIAINKPPGLLVHRTKLAADAIEFALQTLRNQIDQHVFPIHRLDRKTGGVLLFALNEEMLKTMQKEFAKRKIAKKYLAIVRGYTDDEEIINYPLKKENGKMQDAITNYTTLDRAEINVAFGKHQTSRYSLLIVQPVTGRHHQIRKHLAHVHHPIIADRPHGCSKQNKLFKEQFSLMTMMLHARELRFRHPVSGKEIEIVAGLDPEFQRMIALLGFTYFS